MAKASKKEEEVKKPKPVRKKQQTVRQRSETEQNRKPRRLRSTAGKIASPLKKARVLGKREYHVVPLPDNRAGNILRKRVRIFPSFVVNAWREIRLVTWPGRSETIRLTIAVFVFAVVFAVIVGFLDYGLDKLFKEVILK